MATPDNQAVLGDATGLFYNSGILQLYTLLPFDSDFDGLFESEETAENRVKVKGTYEMRNLLRKSFFYY